MDAGFVKAQSDNLPKVDVFMMREYFTSHPNFTTAEMKGIKASRSQRESYGDSAIGYVQVKREGDICTVKARITPEHNVRQKSYVVIATCNETEETVLSVQCEDCAAHLAMPPVETTYKQELVQSKDRKHCFELELLIPRTSPSRCSPVSNAIHSAKQNSEKKQKISSQKEKYACESCDKTFAIKKRLISHVRMHMSRKGFYCAVCDKVIYKHTEANHQQIHKREYRCKYCQKQLSTLGCLIKHERIHTADKPYTCNMCLKQCICARSLAKHKRSHMQERKHACEICKKRFKEKFHLTSHARIHDGETRKTRKTHSCQFCSMKFVSKYKQVIHERIHTGEKPFICDICKKSFKAKIQVRVHMRIHIRFTGQRPFSCTTCGKNFRYKSDLSQHLRRSHLVTKPFPCDVCGKCFSMKRQLGVHKTIHTGEKTVSCEICAKVFSCKRYLSVHFQRVHVDERRIYTCDICDKQFGAARYLTLHKRSHFNIRKVHICAACNKIFRKKYDLTKHMVARHGQKEDLS